MRKYVIAVVLMALGGVGISFYLIPSEEEVQLLQTKDAQRNGITVDHVKRYQQGDRSAVTLAGMAAELIRQNRGEEIQDELESHLQENPGSLNVRKQLAEIYRKQERYTLYLEQIKIIAAQEPTEAHYKLLADTYNYLQQYDKQIEALRDLIEISNGGDPEYYADLAIILALQERRAESAGVVEELRAKYPDYRSFKLTMLVTNTLIDSGKMEEAYQEAASWTSGQPGMVHVAQLTNALNYGGRPDLALQLIEPFRMQIKEEEDLFIAFVNASINGGKKDRAYQLMTEAHDNDTLPTPLYGPFIQLAVERKEMAFALALLDEMEAADFTQKEAMQLLDFMRQESLTELQEKLLALFGQPDYLQRKPALDAYIALMQREEDEDEKVSRALAHRYGMDVRIMLAAACARHEKEACFDELAARFSLLTEMSPRELNQYAQLYIQARRAEEVAESIYALADESPLEPVKLAAIRIAAATGDVERITHWINRQGMTASSVVLAELYYTATDRYHFAAAVPLASMLYDREPSARHRDFLITAYLRTNQPAKALPLLRASLEENPEQEANYLAALVAVARTDASYRQELADYVLPLLQDDSVSASRKYPLVFALINTGQKKAAEPTIKRYAKSEGGEWETLYNQVFAVASAPAVVPVTERSRAFRVALANNPNTSEKVKRDLAFSLLDDGYREDAIMIFFELAQTAQPGSREMNDLLYLWGERLSSGQLNWLIQRASHASTPPQQMRWAELIARYGGDYALLEYVATRPEVLSHPSLRREYFAALSRQSDASTFVDGMLPWVDSTVDPAALKDYANAAIAHGTPEGAIYALEKAQRIAPGDPVTLRMLAQLHYGRADYSEAETYLRAYEDALAQQPIPEPYDYETLFYKASLAHRDGNNTQAGLLFGDLVDRGLVEADTIEKQTIYYTSLFHLGQQETARQGFYTLLNAYPDKKNVLADFMSLLIEYEHDDEARLAANQYDRHSPYYQTLAGSLNIDADHIRSVKPHQNGQELLIEFDGLAPETSQFFEEQPPAWMEGMNQGRESVLIQARAGTELRFRPTGKGIAVVAGLANIMSPDERRSREQDLRLQLLYTQLELQDGETKQAKKRLEQLESHYPANPKLVGYHATVEQSTGNWPRALQLLEQAQQMQPYNEDFASLHARIQDDHPQEIKLDRTYRRIGNSDENRTSISAKVRPDHQTEMGIRVENNDVEASRVRRSSSGSIQTFETSRQRGELYMAHYFDNGDRLKGSLFANSDTGGAGAYYAFNNPAGRTEVVAEYQRPYWDFVEAVTENANRSRVGLRHQATLDERTSVYGEVYYNRYNIELEDNVAQSVLIRANITRRIRDENPTVAVGYGFDGEYLTGEKRRDLANGDIYRTFPLVSREIHYPNVIVSDELTDDTRAEAVAGWAFDRLGAHGPQVSGQITHDITDDLEAQFRASYGLQTQDTDQNVTQMGGHLRYKF